MMRPRHAVLCCLLSFGAYTSNAGAQPVPPPPPPVESVAVDPARKLFEDGTAALTDGRFADAAEKLRAAWRQKKSHDVAGNLGAALLKLGEHVEAARYLAYAVEHHPVGGKPSVKKWTEALLSEAKAKVTEVRLRLTGDAPAPAIRVDGAPIESAFVGASLFVAPGKRVIEASARGYQTAQQTIDGQEGRGVDVTLALVPAAPAQRSAMGPAIAFGAGGVGLIVGVAAAVVTGVKTGDLKATCGEALVCPTSARGDGDAAFAAAHTATVGFVLAGLGAAVGATLLLLPSKTAQPARVGVVLSPTFTGVKGEF